MRNRNRARPIVWNKEVKTEVNRCLDSIEHSTNPLPQADRWIRETCDKRWPKEKWTKMYTNYNISQYYNRKRNLKLIKFIVDNANLDPNSVAGAVGSAGAGIEATIASLLNKRGAGRVIASDFEKGFISYVNQAVIPFVGKKLSIHQADGRKLVTEGSPFQKNQLDAIISIHAGSLTKAPVTSLKQMHMTLKPGGRAIIMAPPRTDPRDRGKKQDFRNFRGQARRVGFRIIPTEERRLGETRLYVLERTLKGAKTAKN